MTGSIRQRSANSWEITIDLGRDERGKRIRRFVSVKGTKKQAQQQLRELLTELDGGIVPSTERIMMRDWLPRWMADCVEGHLSLATQDRYRGIIKNHLIPAIGHIELKRLSPTHVQSLQTKLLDNGMDPKGVNLVRNVLSGAIKHALSLELILRNPVSAVKAVPEPDREVQPPPMDAVTQMLELAKPLGDWLYPALYLLVYTGIRRGELLALRWDAVDLEKAEIRILWSLGRRSNGLHLSKPKTVHGNRTVSIDASTVAVLRRHKEHQDLEKAQLSDAYTDNGIVFADPLGQWLNPMKMTRRVHSLGKKVGHPEGNPHNIRHFHGSVTVEQGTNPAVVSERLGHSNPTITMKIYAHALPGWQRQAADDFARTMAASQDGSEDLVGNDDAIDTVAA